LTAPGKHENVGTMSRLKQVTFGPQNKKASLTIDADTAAIFRRIASYEGRPKGLTALLNDMIVEYVRTKLPNVHIELSDEPIPDDNDDGKFTPAERRTAQRRGTKPEVGKPAGVKDRRTRERRAKT
jgi:hypothetical protein